MDVISSYTQAQAVADGALVGVTQWASNKEGGFLGGFEHPVFLTRALWATIEAIPASLDGVADIRGRAHDVLFLARLCAASALMDNGAGANFQIHLPRKGARKRTWTLRIVPTLETGDLSWVVGFPGDF